MLSAMISQAFLANHDDVFKVSATLLIKIYTFYTCSTYLDIHVTLNSSKIS